MGGTPQKILAVKNMQSLARFWSNLKLGDEYLRNGWRYLKSVSYSIDCDFFRVRQSKSGDVRFCDLLDFNVELYSPKTHYSEKHISAPKGCCDPKFLHALENDQVLLAHFSPKTGAALTTFFKGGSKIGLKCNNWAPITSQLSGVARRNFGTWRAYKMGC